MADDDSHWGPRLEKRVERIENSINDLTQIVKAFIGDTERRFNDMQGRFDHQFNSLRSEVRSGFDGVNQRLSRFESRIENLETKAQA